MKTRIDLRKIKNELKADAKLLREDRLKLKEAQRAGEDCWKKQSFLAYLKADYRNKHIAYGLMKGKTYEQIERKVRPGNEPDWYSINKIVKSYTEENTIEDTYGDIA
jgi:hypothetical protein